MLIDSIFEVLQANEINDNWSTYLSLLKTLFLIRYNSNKTPVPIPEIQLPQEIITIRYLGLFNQLLSFFSIYTIIPVSYFQQLFNFFIDCKINISVQKSIYHFFQTNFTQLLQFISDENLVQLITSITYAPSALKQLRLKFFFMIQEKNLQ